MNYITRYELSEMEADTQDLILLEEKEIYTQLKADFDKTDFLTVYDAEEELFELPKKAHTLALEHLGL